ncbi:MAG: hypothetical protein V1791_04805, partial [Pseudomonadota bacterium]
MQFITITAQDKQLPAYLKERFPGGTPPVISAIGNPDILAERKSPWTALFCSKDCPGSVILPALDHVRGLRDAGQIVVSGFHSPM